MSFDGDALTATTPVPRMREPRLARWLAWTIRLLVIWPLVRMWFLFFDFGRLTAPSDIKIQVLLHDAPYIAAWLCLPLAGLALRYWRKATGLRLACSLIWLAPLISICDLLLREHMPRDLELALLHVVIIVLKSGIFHAAGFTAFLLDNPRVRNAYGLQLTGFATADAPALLDDGETSRRSFRLSWMGSFCCLLLGPMLVLLPILSEGHIQYDSYWQARPFLWQLTSLSFAGAPALIAMCLSKYRQPALLTLAQLLLLTYAILPSMPTMLGFVKIAMPGLHAISTLPTSFGFDLLAAFAWTAYFRTAPAIRARYHGEPVAGVNVDAF